MNATRVIVGAALAIAIVSPGTTTLLAHHSFAAEFDANKPVTLTGAVTKVEWSNPHIWVYFDVKDEHGTVQPWQCEGGAPNTLTRNGWSKDSLKVDDQITVGGWLAKNGTRTCNMRVVKMADGRTVFAGSSAGNATTPKQ